MKKNLISIVILALLIVNIVLTAVMMFGIMSTNKKTAALVGKIASAISLELGEVPGQEEEKVVVSMEDTVPYTIADMTIQLKQNPAGEGEEPEEKVRYAVLSVTLSMNSRHKDYKTYGEQLNVREDLIRGKINDIVGSHTAEEFNSDPQQIKKELLQGIQELFGSDFIFDVTLSRTTVQ